MLFFASWKKLKNLNSIVAFRKGRAEDQEATPSLSKTKTSGSGEIL